MAIYLGGTPIRDIRIGSTLVQSVWLGGTKIWQRATVSVSGGSVVGFAFAGTISAGVRFNADGSVDQHIGSTYTPINASTDWVRPTSAASGNYQIRARKTSGSNPTAAYSDALNTWLSLNVARAWAVARSGNGETTSVLSIEIRFSGGTTLATGIYTLVATRESYDY